MQRNKPRKNFSSSLLVALLCACVHHAASADQPEPIQLLALNNLTGDASALDGPCYRGAELAVEQINATGGVLGRPLQLIPVDTRSDTETTGRVAEEAVAAHPDAVAGFGFTYSAFAKEAGPAFQQAGLPFVTPGATDPRLPAEVGDQFFLACYGDNAQARVMARYARKELGLKRVAVWIDESRDYPRTVGRYFVEAFEKLGGQTIVTRYESKDPDFETMAQALLSDDAIDGLYAAILPHDSAMAIQTVRTAGSNIPLMSGDGWDDPGIFTEAKQAHLTDLYFTTHHFLGVHTPVATAFAADYQTKFDRLPPNAFAPLGYDTVYLLADAIRRAGSTEPDAIRIALSETKDFRGVVGPISYEPGQRVPIKPVEVIEIKKGELLPQWVGLP